MQLISAVRQTRKPAIGHHRGMTRLVAMCGMAFSGKTTLAKAICAALRAEYLGLDDINAERGLRGGEGIPCEEWEKTSQIAVERLEAVLSSGRDAVLDDTLCFRWLRERYAAVARRHRATFLLVHVATPLSEIHDAIATNEVSLQRNPILAEVFEEHVNSFEIPGDDERPLRYTRSLPVEEWIAGNLTEVR